MRIALLLSGLPRMWDGPVHSQVGMFGEPDVFCHFWDTIDAAEKRRLTDTLRPKVCVFEPLPDFGFADRYEGVPFDNVNVPSRMLSQYTSWQRVGTLFAPYAPQYGLAVRSRTDLEFVQPVELTLPADGTEALLVYVFPDNPSLLFDAFAMGTPNAVLWFHAMLSRVWHYVRQASFNPESLLRAHIMSYPGTLALQIPNHAEPKPLPFFVRRPHMAGWPVEQCLGEDAGGAKWLDPEIVAAFKAFHTIRHGPDGAAFVDRFAAGIRSALVSVGRP